VPYFDHNATTPLSPAARAAWLAASDTAWHNPSSPYRQAARAREMLESCRSEIASTLGAATDRLVFNSGATEGANAVFAWTAVHARPATVALVGATEHPCVQAAASAYWPDRIEHLPVSARGEIDLNALAARLRRGGVGMVSLMAANNETGTLHPFQEVAHLCREGGVRFHLDAAQLVGKAEAVGLAAADYVTVSAHKFGGPKGTGLLLVPDGTDFVSLRGGEQERGHRAGTEDLAGVAAMAAALRTSLEQLASGTERAGWRDAFESRLKEAIPGLEIAGAGATRLWNTSLLIMPLGESLRWVRKLDRRGFQVSSGSACSTGKEGPSPTLTAMGYGPEAAKRALRVSAGWSTAREEWEALAEATLEVWRELSEEAGGLTEVVVV
jgi:cysteine desulfurase